MRLAWTPYSGRSPNAQCNRRRHSCAGLHVLGMHVRGYRARRPAGTADASRRSVQRGLIVSSNLLSPLSNDTSSIDKDETLADTEIACFERVWSSGGRRSTLAARPGLNGRRTRLRSYPSHPSRHLVALIAVLHLHVPSALSTGSSTALILTPAEVVPMTRRRLPRSGSSSHRAECAAPQQIASLTSAAVRSCFNESFSRMTGRTRPRRSTRPPAPAQSPPK